MSTDAYKKSDGCSSETRSQSNGCSSDSTVPSPFGVQWESPGTPRTSQTGSTVATRSQRLGREFTAQLWNTHLLQKAIGETINLDREHIAARADAGVSPTFRISPKRQAFQESSTICDGEQSPSTSEDPARRLIDSMVADSRNYSLHSSSGSKPSSRASSVQAHPGIRNRTDTSLDLTISLGIHRLNELARKRNSNSPPRSPVSETAIRCSSPRSSPRGSSCSFKWPDAKKVDNTLTWPEPKKLVAMVEEDVDSRYKHVQRAKYKGSPLQVLPSMPDNKNFVEFAAPSPRQSPKHSPRCSPRNAFSRASSCSSPSKPVENVSDVWKAHHDQDREISHSSDSAFRRSHDDVHKAVEIVAFAQHAKRASTPPSAQSSRSTSRIRGASESPLTKDSSADASPSLRDRIETVTNLQDHIESLLKAAREKQTSATSKPSVSVARSSSQQPFPTVGTAPNLATAKRANSRSRSGARSESPSQRSPGRAFSNPRRSDLQSTRMARGAAPPPRVVPFPQRF